MRSQPGPSRYLFEPCFARPGTGHDKGGVESRGKAIRLQHLAPVPRGESLGQIAQALLASWEEEKTALRPVELSKAEWVRWLERAATMNDGELISYKSDKEEPVQQKLVWSDRKWGRFVFVDREGHKGLDLRQEEVAAAMSKGRLLILEGWDRPLMDRAKYPMLQLLQDRVVVHATHDPLNVLLKRRHCEVA